jgi:dolichyl-phosphate beta-glucosyltransferase
MIEAPDSNNEPGRRSCIVVPCYNEARRLQSAAFREFAERSDDTLLIFVDDGSTDETAATVEAMRSGLEHAIHLLTLGPNRGKAEAVRQGILFALDQFGPSVVGFWDADLATPLEAIRQLQNVLVERKDIEMVFGARVKLLGRHVQRRAIRHYLGRVFATAVSAVLEMPIYDTQCGAKLFRVRNETRSIFESPFLSKWVFDVEILARYKLLYEGEQKRLVDAIYEYPLETWVDVAGSKVRAGDFFVALLDIVRIRGKYLT